MRADRGVGGGSHRASRLDKKSTWRPGLLACPELSRLVACGFTRGHKSHRGNIGIPFLRVERRHRGGSSTCQHVSILHISSLQQLYPAPVHCNHITKKKTTSSANKAVYVIHQCLEQGSRTKQSKPFSFIFFNGEATALQKVCVCGVWYGCAGQGWYEVLGVSRLTRGLLQPGSVS